MTSLSVGDPAPPFSLPDQHGTMVSLEDLSGRPVLLFFYPKANTPGCTTQACSLRDVAGDVGDARIIGISPDSQRRQRNFDVKHSLRFPLLSDPEHEVAEAYGIWGEKKLYGKTYMGVIRSAFLIDADGSIAAVFSPVSPKDTAPALLEALRS